MTSSIYVFATLYDLADCHRGCHYLKLQQLLIWLRQQLQMTEYGTDCDRGYNCPLLNTTLFTLKFFSI